ncbi:MAG: polysaccharide pyruvyl transferase CsaB [Trueperaceae bacterium]|nr:MAG: polysaccharide pyruvyl transferase CsaB [Trueperaceae bacterium]
MNILVSGYYGFGNIGDEAILAVLTSHLTEYGHRVTVLSQDPHETKCLHGVGAVHRTRGVLPALLTTDVLISGGGGLLQDRTSRRSLLYYLSLIQLAKRIGKRVIIFGQSIGPLSNRGLQSVVKALTGLPIAVRDRPSQSLLAQYHIEAELVADPALLLFGPNQAIDPHPEAPVLLIPRDAYPDVTSALTQVAVALNKKGLPVATLAFHPERDEAAVKQILTSAPETTHLRATSYREALLHTACARYVISARLHGLILAAACRRGFSGLVYDPKVAAFLDEAGAPAFDLPPDPSSLIRVALEQPVPEPQAMTALRSRALRGLAWLDSNLHH